MLRNRIKFGLLALAAILAPLLIACNTESEPTVTPEPVSAISISDAWARPAAMVMGDDSAMPGMTMDDKPMDMDDKPTDMGGDMPAMGGHGPASGTGAIYFTIENSGDADDMLVEVFDLMVESAGDLSDVIELHETSMTDGVMKMQKLETGIAVPAGETVLLKPGGLHVMLMQIKRSLEPGDVVSLGLRFQSGTEEMITAEVRQP